MGKQKNEDILKKENAKNEDVEVNKQNDFSNGPVRDRKLTDFIFCILMLAFWGFCIWLAMYSFQQGDITKLKMIMDDDGKACGKQEYGTQDYPYAYFYQPLNKFGSVLCVKECPQWQLGQQRQEKIDCYLEGESKNGITCNSSVNFSFSQLPDKYLDFYNEQFLIYNTTLLFDTFCFMSDADPSQVDQNWFKNMTIVSQVADKTVDYIQDIIIVKWYILWIGLIALFISLLSLFLIRLLAGFFVWFTILIFIISVFVLAGYTMKESNRLKSIAAQEHVETNDSNAFFDSVTLYRISIILFVIGGIVFLIFLFNLGTIALSIAILKSAAIFVYETFWIVLLPILFFVIILAYFIFWLLVLGYLYSIGEPEKRLGLPFITINRTNKDLGLLVAHIFSVLWNIAFINYSLIFIIASTCVIWYYNNRDSPNYFPRPILTSFWWAFRYHLGSIALGSFILAVIWFVQLVLGYIAKKVDDMKKNGIQSKVLEWTVKCLMICVSCFERIVKFISKLGFIKVAVSSESFCVSCFKSFTLLFSNPMKFGILHALGSIMTLIGKLFVSAICGVIGYLLLSYNQILLDELSNQLIPIIVFIIEGYLVSSLFFMIYGISTDTIIVCFFQDKENADKQGRAVHAPAPMVDFYEKFKKDQQIFSKYQFVKIYHRLFIQKLN